MNFPTLRNMHIEIWVTEANDNRFKNFPAKFTTSRLQSAAQKIHSYKIEWIHPIEKHR